MRSLRPMQAAISWTTLRFQRCPAGLQGAGATSSRTNVCENSSFAAAPKVAGGRRFAPHGKSWRVGQVFDPPFSGPDDSHGLLARISHNPSGDVAYAPTRAVSRLSRHHLRNADTTSWPCVGRNADAARKVCVRHSSRPNPCEKCGLEACTGPAHPPHCQKRGAPLRGRAPHKRSRYSSNATRMS